MDPRTKPILNTILSGLQLKKLPTQVDLAALDTAGIVSLLNELSKPPLTGMQSSVEALLGEVRLKITYRYVTQRYTKPTGWDLTLDMSKKDNHDRTLLHYIVLLGQYGDLGTALTQSDLNAMDKNHDTPLHLAVRYGRINMIKQLVEAGADTMLHAEGHPSPFSLAIAQGNMDAIKALLGPTGRLDPEKHHDLLHEAFFCDSEPHQNPDVKRKVIETLIEAGADVNEENEAGDTVLHAVLKSKKIDKNMVDMLLQKGANIRAVNRLGYTPLHIASEKEGSIYVSDAAILEDLAGKEYEMRPKPELSQNHTAQEQEQIKSAALIDIISTAKDEAKFLRRIPPVLSIENEFDAEIQHYPKHSGFFHTRQVRAAYLPHIFQENTLDVKDPIATRKEKYHKLLKELFLQYRSIDDSRSTISLDIEKSLLKLLNLYQDLQLWEAHEKRDAFWNRISTFFKHAMHGVGYRHDKKDDPVYKLIKTAMKDEIPELFDERGKLKGENKDRYKQLVAIDEKETAFFFNPEDVKLEDFTHKPS